MEEKREYSSFDWFEAVTNEDIINTVIEQKIENIINTAQIAKIITVNENKVDLELLNGDKLVNIPVCVTAFHNWTVSLPLKKDDVGIVVFMKYEISDYKEAGSFQGEKLSLFSQNNGLFIPFALYNQPDITEDIIITNEKINITINKDNEVLCKINDNEINIDKAGNILIKGKKAVIETDSIELGKSANEPLVLGNKLLTEINKIITMIKTHTHGSNGGGPIPASPDLSAGLQPLKNNILSQTSKTK